MAKEPLWVAIFYKKRWLALLIVVFMLGVTLYFAGRDWYEHQTIHTYEECIRAGHESRQDAYTNDPPYCAIGGGPDYKAFYKGAPPK